MIITILALKFFIAVPGELSDEQQAWPNQFETHKFNELVKAIESRHRLLLQLKKRIKVDACIQKLPKSKIFLSENGLPFDGQVKGQNAWINLLNSKDYSEREFSNLIYHELVHLNHSDSVAKRLYPQRALFEEGQALYALSQFDSEFDVYRYLGWTQKTMRSICQNTWNLDFIRKNLVVLFSTTRSQLIDLPRFGYWLGLQIFKELHPQKWCDLSFKNFLNDVPQLLAKIQRRYCR